MKMLSKIWLITLLSILDTLLYQGKEAMKVQSLQDLTMGQNILRLSLMRNGGCMKLMLITGKEFAIIDAKMQGMLSIITLKLK